MLKTNKVIDLVHQVENKYGSVKYAPDDDVNFLKIRAMCDNSSDIKWKVTSEIVYTAKQDIYKAYLMMVDEGYTRKYALDQCHVTPIRLDRLHIFTHVFKYIEKATNRMVIANSQKSLINRIALHGLVGPTTTAEISWCISYDSNYYLGDSLIGYVERENFAKRLVIKDSNN